jgi:hypothetical protein
MNDIKFLDTRKQLGVEFFKITELLEPERSQTSLLLEFIAPFDKNEPSKDPQIKGDVEGSRGIFGERPEIVIINQRFATLRVLRLHIKFIRWEHRVRLSNG